MGFMTYMIFRGVSSAEHLLRSVKNPVQTYIAAAASYRRLRKRRCEQLSGRDGHETTGLMDRHLTDLAKMQERWSTILTQQKEAAEQAMRLARLKHLELLALHRRLETDALRELQRAENARKERLDRQATRKAEVQKSRHERTWKAKPLTMKEVQAAKAKAPKPTAPVSKHRQSINRPSEALTPGSSVHAVRAEAERIVNSTPWGASRPNEAWKRAVAESLAPTPKPAPPLPSAVEGCKLKHLHARFKAGGTGCPSCKSKL
jgi:hypothetical protein